MVEFSGTSEAEVRGRWRKGTPLVISYKKRAINHATTSNQAASQASNTKLHYQHTDMNSAQSDYTTNERRRKLLACLEATLQVTTNRHHPNSWPSSFSSTLPSSS